VHNELSILFVEILLFAVEAVFFIIILFRNVHLKIG